MMLPDSSPHSKTFPISVQSLATSLPHRPPMVWIHQVLRGTEIEGTCEIVLDPSGPQFTSTGLRQTSLVEWMAQGLGYFRAATSTDVSDRTYVVALKDIEYCSLEAWREFQSQIQMGTKALVHVKIQRALGPVFLVNGEVTTEAGFTLAKGSFKCFAQPRASESLDHSSKK